MKHEIKRAYLAPMSGHVVISLETENIKNLYEHDQLVIEVKTPGNKCGGNLVTGVSIPLREANVLIEGLQEVKKLIDESISKRVREGEIKEEPPEWCECYSCELKESCFFSKEPRLRTKTAKEPAAEEDENFTYKPKEESDEC